MQIRWRGEALNTHRSPHRFRGKVEVRVGDESVRVAVEETLSRLPEGASNIPTLASISTKEASEEGNLAGLD